MALIAYEMLHYGFVAYLTVDLSLILFRLELMSCLESYEIRCWRRQEILIRIMHDNM